MTALWTCHRCGVVVRSDGLDDYGEPIGEERELPERWCRFFVTCVDEGETVDRQVDLRVDGEDREHLDFCPPCANIAIDSMIALRSVPTIELVPPMSEGARATFAAIARGVIEAAPSYVRAHDSHAVILGAPARVSEAKRIGSAIVRTVNSAQRTIVTADQKLNLPAWEWLPWDDEILPSAGDVCELVIGRDGVLRAERWRKT